MFQSALEPRDFQEGATDMQNRLATLLQNYSLEMTVKDMGKLEEAAHAIPPGSMVSVTFLPNESDADRVAAASVLRRLGLRPVPHIAARRLKSEAELEAFLDRLAEEARIDQAFVIAGDCKEQQGPLQDALAVIRTGLLGKYGIRHVGIGGYPEGHPGISDDKLWKALDDKLAALQDLGLDASIMTQFAFDAAPILGWLAELRGRGVYVPVRIGIPGPASVRTLLRFAAQCGVGASAKVMAKYGVSITRLFDTAGPERIITNLAAGFAPSVHGEVLFHFYPFGGLAKTAHWVSNFRAAQGVDA